MVIGNNVLERMSNILSHGWGFIQIPEYWKVTLYNHKYDTVPQWGTAAGHGSWMGGSSGDQSHLVRTRDSLTREGEGRTIVIHLFRYFAWFILTIEEGRETIHSLRASIMLTSSWDFIYSAGCPNQRPNIIRLLNKEIKYSPLCLLVLGIRNQGQSAAVATSLVEFSVVEIWLLKQSQNCQRMVPK